MEVKIGSISSVTKFFARENVNEELVSHYAELLNSGVKLPPITVYENTYTGDYVILDGFHTYHAALKVGAESIEVQVLIRLPSWNVLLRLCERTQRTDNP
jgi:hypothetical protein